MRHFVFKAVVVAAAMFLLSIGASAQNVLETDNQDMQYTVIRVLAYGEEVNVVGSLEWKGDAVIRNLMFDTDNFKIVDDLGAVYSGDAVQIMTGAIPSAVVEQLNPGSRPALMIKIKGVGSDATAFTSIDLPYKCSSDSGTLTGKFSWSNELKFK